MYNKIVFMSLVYQCCFYNDIAILMLSNIIYDIYYMFRGEFFIWVAVVKSNAIVVVINKGDFKIATRKKQNIPFGC